MSQGRIRKHHFVPKILQKAFRFEGDRVWYTERQPAGRYKRPEQRNIEKTFRLEDFYTIDVNGEQSDIVEKNFYGSIDDYLGKVLPSVFSAFDEGATPTFEGEALNSLRKVVLELIKRTPHFTKNYDDASIGREIVAKEIAHYELHDPENPQLNRARADLQDHEVLLKLGRTVRVTSVTKEMKNANSLLEEFDVRWAITDGRCAFILSELIAYRIGNGEPNGLKFPNAEIWMPISPRIALVLVRDPHKRIPLRCMENARHVREINEYAAANSNRIASHSERLLLSLTR